MIGNYYDGVRMVGVIIGTMVFLLRCAGVHPNELFHAQGVVNSSINLPCDIPQDLHVDIIRWYLNTSLYPFLTYVPRDDFLDPSDHDPRYSISVSEGLDISRLKKSDSGKYTCIIKFVELREDLTSSLYVTVQDGCTMWEFSPPIVSTTRGCSSGDVVAYAQKCSFTCQEGFRLVGNASTECQGDGELINQPPHCAGVICTIDILSPHLMATNTSCSNGSHVDYGTICEFECTAGYNLNGNARVSVTCANGNAHDFPECENDSGQPKLALISLILIIPFSLISIWLLVWWYRRKSNVERNRYEYDSVHYAEKTVGLQQKQFRSALRTSKNKVSDEFMGSLRYQVAENIEVMIRVLEVTEQAELSTINRLSKVQFRANKALYKTLNPSVPDAFIGYVAEIVSCVEQSNPDLVDDLIDVIISKTGIASDGKKLHLDTATEGPTEQEDIAALESYFYVVYPAFVRLLSALRHRIEDDVVRRQRTADIFNICMTNDTNNEEELKTKSLPSSNPSSMSSRNESKFDKYFAGRCIRNINKNENVEDRIRMRYRILHIMMEPPYKTDVTENNE